MKKYEVSIPVIVSTLENHSNIKASLLELIEREQKISYDSISKTDWNISLNFDRDYVKIFTENAYSHMKNIFFDLGYSKFEIKNIWFQQYEKNSFHHWHLHSGVDFTNVYYLELPSTELITQIKNPMNFNEFVKINVNEGDILTMPGHIVHRSPKNLFGERKTVISFNCNVDFPR
jgi:hypothetical protein